MKGDLTRDRRYCARCGRWCLTLRRPAARGIAFRPGTSRIHAGYRYLCDACAALPLEARRA